MITYHSLEDRLVKNFMRSGNFGGKVEKDFYGRVQTPFEVVTRKAVVPTPEEIERNPRSRSAKLRIAELSGRKLLQRNIRPGGGGDSGETVPDAQVSR